MVRVQNCLMHIDFTSGPDIKGMRRILEMRDDRTDDRLEGEQQILRLTQTYTEHRIHNERLDGENPAELLVRKTSRNPNCQR